MALIDPGKIRPLHLVEGKELSLLMPIGGKSRPFLIAPWDNKVAVILLEGEGQFGFWPADESDGDDKGLLITDFNISVDLDSASEIPVGPKSGTLIRRGDTLAIVSRPFADIHQAVFIPLLTGLPKSTANFGVAFRKWEISIGEGDKKDPLFTFDVA